MYEAAIKIVGRWQYAIGLMKTNVSIRVMVLTYLNKNQL